MTDKHLPHKNATTAPDKKRLSLNRDADDGAPKLEERLHKVLAQAGLGSRRALEERITQGLIKVNGDVATVGQSIRGGDRIDLDGKTFVASALNEPARVLIYNKPEGEVTTREDPEGRPTIFEALPRLKGARWIAVGRLDINTTGLLVLTTDGELANNLMHPSREVEREYVCRIHGEVPENIVDRLKRGVALDDGPAKFDEIERINSSDSHSWFRVIVTEGRNREVRRLWESQEFQVSRLKRIRYGTLTLPRLLKRGQSQELPLEEVEALQRELGLEGGAQVLTLQPVIGQRKARAEIHIAKEDRQGKAYVNGSMADEGRELRRFDHVREDRPRRGGPGGRPSGPGRGYQGAPRSAGPRGNEPGGPRGPSHGSHGGGRDDQPPASYSHDRPARGPGGGPGGGYRGRPSGPNSEQPRPYSPRPNNPGAPRPAGKPYGQGRPPRPAGAPGHAAGNSTEFRSWYVPEGVDTGPRQARPGGNPNSARPGPGRPGAGGPRKPGGPGGPGGFRGAPRGPGQNAGPGEQRPFTPRPQGDRPRGDRPQGDRPQGGMPRGPNAGPGRSGPHAPRPGGNRPNQPPRGPGGPPQHARPHGPRPDRSNSAPRGPRGPRYEGLPRDED